MVFCAFIAFLFLHVISCRGACPDYWTPFHGSCYHLFSELEQWTQAQLMCSLEDSNLATIETSAENRFLKNIIKNSSGTVAVWFGASDVVNEGEYRWINSHLPVNYTDWGPTEPNGADSQNCLQFWHFGNNKWQWDDESCTYKHRFICEKRDPEVIG